MRASGIEEGEGAQEARSSSRVLLPLVRTRVGYRCSQPEGKEGQGVRAEQGK